MWFRALKISSGVLTILLLCASCFAQSAGPDEETAEIVGEVMIEYGERAPFAGDAGRKFKVDGLLVYLFTWDESAPIRNVLKKLDEADQHAKLHPDDLIKAGKIVDLIEELYDRVRKARPMLKMRTNKEGQFVFKNLRMSKKYFVVATDASEPREDGVQYFFERAMGPLAPGRHEIRFVDKIG